MEESGTIQTEIHRGNPEKVGFLYSMYARKGCNEELVFNLNENLLIL